MRCRERLIPGGARRCVSVALWLVMVATGATAVWAEPSSDSCWVDPIGDDAPPILVRLELDRNEKLIPGLQAESVQIVVRNISKNLVVAVRGANWWEAGVASLNWYGPVQGSVKILSESQSGQAESNTLADPEPPVAVQVTPARIQSVILNRTIAALTDLAFEKGVLLPGEQITIPLPFTPQQYATNTVHIDYVTAGNEGVPWRELVLVPDAPPRFNGEVLVMPDDRIIKNRHGQGSLGLLRSTMGLDSTGLPIQSADFELQIPLRKEYEVHLTGGITREEAAGRAGATIEEINHLGYYLPDMHTWFFIGADEVTRTLRLEDGAWVFDFGLPMPAFAPELFGRNGKPTRVLLNPEIFNHLVPVNTPHNKRYYDPGLTELNAEQWWQVMTYAKGKKGLALDAIVIDPNGLGQQWVLTLGVKTDSSGQ